MTDAPRAATRRARRGRRPRRRATVVSVLGELLLTAGVVVLLYAAWQMWIGDIIMSASANDKGQQISQAWAKAPAPALPPVIDDGNGVDGAHPRYEPPVMTPPANGVPWGAQMHVPRWGSDYNVQIAGGVTRPDTLDHGWIGVYPTSGMPGQPGNFTMAAHRTTWGKPFNQLDKLHLNDAIVIETEQGWYTYRFRTLEYVTPDSVDVLDPVPQEPGVAAGGRYITLTACSPLYSLAERIVAYGVFESFQPRALGAPASLKAVS
ncbi:MAG: class E sortase [Microbacterium sp.]|uniref:class E sortase n=1 Tax=Microbacterium sp. TaxID=51671 RepID=UPI0028300D9B|nr:class E sortase [Microbacterium sp.]MDR2322588.1 class E sortase [Microbacterium sp.]